MDDVTAEVVVEAPEEATEEVSAETAEVETEEEVKTEEVATVSEEEKESEPSGPKKVDASTRVQEAVNQKNEAVKEADLVKEQLAETSRKLEELSAKFEKTQAEQPNFIDIDYDKVNTHLSQLESEIEDARLEGNIYQANLIEEQKREMIAEIKANEKQKEDWEKGIQAKESRTQTVEQRVQELDKAAEFYRKEMDIPKGTWDQMGGLFAEQLNKDKLLGKKFADMVDRQGAVAAVEWAYTHTKDKLVKPDQKAAKEEAKEKIAGLKGGGGEKVTLPKTWDALMKMHSKEIQKFHAAHPKEYKKLHDKHLAA